MYFVLKAVDKKINADGEAVEYLLQNEGGRQAWYKVEDIKLAIRNGQLIVQNLTLTNDDRLLMNFKKALDLEKRCKKCSRGSHQNSVEEYNEICGSGIQYKRNSDLSKW